MSGIGRETPSLSLLRHTSPPQKILPIGRGPRDLKLSVQKIPLVHEANLEQPHPEHFTGDEEREGRQVAQKPTPEERWGRQDGQELLYQTKQIADPNWRGSS